MITLRYCYSMRLHEISGRVVLVEGKLPKKVQAGKKIKKWDKKKRSKMRVYLLLLCHA